MNSMEKVYGSGWAAWWRKHSIALQIGTTISCNIAYLADTGHTRKAVTLSMILLGGTTLYCFFSRRRKINARDLIVITGCNSGLGYSLAMHCRAKGAMVLAGVREIPTVPNSNAVEILKNKGVIVHQVDIADEQSVRDFRHKVKELLEERQLVLRALVNNAGVMVFGEFEWQTQKLAEYQVNVNLLGTMRITRELMPILRENHSRIITISSHCANESLPGISIYGATKAALLAWTTSLRVEVRKYGVEVVSFIPVADTEKLTVSVKVTIMGVTISYPYPYPNACESLTNGKCPLSKGDSATYSALMPISKNYPSLRMIIEFSLNDENNNSQVCFKIDGQVTDP
ncbi:D-beta-hydroxybutyrate dehydrogenase, mitochondrial [Acromyrmex echinatior]|uniref:D-beta-hydroxybutyrate dehydrogenase, mitochondrial n=1 Tax=Acromyrmex echinatior TaxID=103372 RepID=F4WDD1_ACREC|nr:D-beta-hydroxybutyrate dehydrogenase, mitochondrial [Acromyrmex echinatior]